MALSARPRKSTCERHLTPPRRDRGTAPPGAPRGGARRPRATRRLRDAAAARARRPRRRPRPRGGPAAAGRPRGATRRAARRAGRPRTRGGHGARSRRAAKRPARLRTRPSAAISTPTRPSTSESCWLSASGYCAAAASWRRSGCSARTSAGLIRPALSIRRSGAPRPQPAQSRPERQAAATTASSSDSAISWASASVDALERGHADHGQAGGAGGGDPGWRVLEGDDRRARLDAQAAAGLQIRIGCRLRAPRLRGR